MTTHKYTRENKIGNLSGTYFAQFEFEFLVRVRAQTGVNLLTAIGLEVCLPMQISGGKFSPLPVSKSTLVSVMVQCRFSYTQWSETQTRVRNSYSN